MKVYTTAVALDLLGADYRWRTSVYSDNPPDSTGTINGDLVLYGRGAPDLITTNRGENSNSIEELAKSLAAKGVKRIQGNVIGDESYFRGDATGDGWLSNDLQWYFGAEASALTINANSIEVSITSSSKMTEQPKVEVNDFDGYIQTTNNLASVESGEPLRIGVKRDATDNNIIVWGRSHRRTRLRSESVGAPAIVLGSKDVPPHPQKSRYQRRRRSSVSGFTCCREEPV